MPYTFFGGLLVFDASVDLLMRIFLGSFKESLVEGRVDLLLHRALKKTEDRASIIGFALEEDYPELFGYDFDFTLEAYKMTQRDKWEADKKAARLLRQMRL